MDAAWIAEYRRETDRHRRRAILDREEEAAKSRGAGAGSADRDPGAAAEASSGGEGKNPVEAGTAGPSSGGEAMNPPEAGAVQADRPANAAIELRRKLWAARYDERKGQPIDYGIRGWVNLMSMKRRIYLPGEKNRIRRDVEEIKKDWQFDLCGEYGEVGGQALYDELYNIALLYMELCDTDRTYNSVLLGLGHISERRRVDKIRKELREMTVEIPERLGVTEELAVFTRAVADAFAYRYPAEPALREHK